MSDEFYEQGWNILRVRSTFERKVEKQLRGLGIDVLAPVSRTAGRDPKTHRPSVIEKVIFTGYVFSRFDDAQRQDIQNNVSYFLGFLRFGEQEAFVSDEELARVQLLLRSEAPIHKRTEMIPGERVRVTRGSMAGLVGEFTRSRGQDEVVLNMPWLGRSIATEIPWDWVEPVEPRLL